MTLLAFQAVILLFIAISFLLVVAVPVVAASPNGWNENKNLLLVASSSWVVLVLIIGILNSSVI
jgi:photosystem II PsbZ protein